jgi:hypothetical protein
MLRQKLCDVLFRKGVGVTLSVSWPHIIAVERSVGGLKLPLSRIVKGNVGYSEDRGKQGGVWQQTALVGHVLANLALWIAQRFLVI